MNEILKKSFINHYERMDEEGRRFFLTALKLNPDGVEQHITRNMYGFSLEAKLLNIDEEIIVDMIKDPMEIVEALKERFKEDLEKIKK